MPVRIYVNFGSNAMGGTNEGSADLGEFDDFDPSIIEKINVKNPQAKQNKAKAATLAMGRMIALQSINYALSNVGQWTGNEQNQVAINNAQELVGMGIMASASPLLAIGTVGFKLATTAIDENIRKNKASVGLAQARARAGYTNDNAANYRRR